MILITQSQWVCAQEATVVIGDKKFISDGSAISIPRENLNVVPPEGWEVVSGFPGTTVVFRAPKMKSERVQRIIQLFSFADSQYVDEIAANEMAMELEEKFSKANNSISGYSLRSQTPVTLNDGNRGWLFYFGFVINDVEMMHAHLLTSSQNRHYVMTYTDVAENFEKETSSKDHLGIAWASMTSLALESHAPKRMGMYKIIGIALGVLSIVLLILIILRNRKAGQVYDDYARGKFPTGFGSDGGEMNTRDDDHTDVDVTIHTEVPDDEEQERLHTDLTFHEQGDTIHDEEEFVS